MCNVVFTKTFHWCILCKIYQIHVHSTNVSVFPRYFALNELLNQYSTFRGPNNYEKKYTKYSYIFYGTGITPVMSISKHKFPTIFMRIFGNVNGVQKDVFIFMFTMQHISINKIHQTTNTLNKVL